MHLGETTFPHWLKWGGGGGWVGIMSDRVRWGTGVTMATAYQWRRLVLESKAVLWNTWCDCLKCLWALVTHRQRKHNLFCVKSNQTSLFWTILRGSQLRETCVHPQSVPSYHNSSVSWDDNYSWIYRNKTDCLLRFFFLKFNNQQCSHKWDWQFWAVLLTPRD